VGVSHVPLAVGPLADFRELSKLSGHSYFYDVMDGAWMAIDGVSAGRRFIVEANNPQLCEDEHSHLIAAVLGKMQ